MFSLIRLLEETSKTDIPKGGNAIGFKLFFQIELGDKNEVGNKALPS